MSTRGIKLLQAPLESLGKFGIAERNHTCLHAAFGRRRKDYGGNISDRDCFRIAIYAVNATTGPEGYFPIMLVFGIIRPTALNVPYPTHIMR